jgi:hypothetical protein
MVTSATTRSCMRPPYIHRLETGIVNFNINAVCK